MSGKGSSQLSKVYARSSIAPQDGVCGAAAGRYALLEVCKRNVWKWEEAVPGSWGVAGRHGGFRTGGKDSRKGRRVYPSIATAT